MEGVAILSQLSPNNHLVRQLFRKPSRANLEKLEYELKKFYTDENEETQEEPTQSEQANERGTKFPVRNPHSSNPCQKTGDNDVPGVVVSDSSDCSTDKSLANSLTKRIQKERIEGYRLRGNYHAQLQLCTTDESRYELARKIIELQPTLDDLNNDLDLVNSGKVPSRYINTSSSLEEYQNYQRIQSYIRRYKNKISTATSISQKKRWQQLLDKYETELKQLL